MKLNIGENIRKYRKQADMTQEQLADRLGTTYQSVSRWENGSTYPDMELLPAISEIFNVSTDILLGMPEVEKERKATEAFDALRREALKSEIDSSAVNVLLRDIRANYLGCKDAWRLWVGNNDCYRNPEVLPEIRLTADEYRKRTPYADSIAMIKTMASVEDEEHMDEFFKKYTTQLDTSERMLRFQRYFEMRDFEKFEPERKYQLFRALNDLLNTRTLVGWSDDMTDLKNAITFQTGLLKLIRGYASDEILDMWIPMRISLGLTNAMLLIKDSNVVGGITVLDKTVRLLEKTMGITESQRLDCSFRQLDGMVWQAEEYWTSLNKNPDEDEERTINFKSRIGKIIFCEYIVPSRFYTELSAISNSAELNNNSEFRILSERVKALIVTRSKKID